MVLEKMDMAWGVGWVGFLGGQAARALDFVDGRPSVRPGVDFVGLRVAIEHRAYSARWWLDVRKRSFVCFVYDR